jgi:hypothetical protein
MKDVRVRLLYPSSVKPEEVGAAIRGMERFRAYGVLHDEAQVGGRDKAALEGVRNGKSIKSILLSALPAVAYYDIHGSLSELFRASDTIPIGLTPARMKRMVEEEFSTRLEPSLGLSREGEGAIVSLFKAREMETASADESVPLFRNGMDNGIALKSIELAVAHELGHVFGRKEHCGKEGCLMQANRDFADFVDRFVMAGAEFCRDCSAKISGTIGRMTVGF